MTTSHFRPVSRSFSTIDESRLRGGWGVKWGAVDPDVTPAWVADMDLGIPPLVKQRLMDAVARQDFGYPYWPADDPVVTAFETRMTTRHGWTPTANRTKVFTDLIQILQVMIEHATAPGDGIALHVPNYPPFLASIERAGRRVIPLPVAAVGAYDVAEKQVLLETLQDSNARMLIVVNPHNPTGRVLTRTELDDLASVAQTLDLAVVSDEIHADLLYDGATHIPFASLNDDAASRTITATSATKGFNIAGLRCAVAHVGHNGVWERLNGAPLDYFGTPSVLSRIATVAAWTECDSWLQQVGERLTTNRQIVADWAATSSYDFRYSSPEATYLSWLDFSRTPLAGTAPAREILTTGRVLLSDGAEFSPSPSSTAQYARVNFATSTAVLERILDGIDTTLATHARRWLGCRV